MAKEGSGGRQRLLLVTDIVLAIVDIALIVVVLSIGFDFGRSDREPVTVAVEEEAPAPDAAAEPAEESTEEPAEAPRDRATPAPERRVQRVYNVSRGDTFFGLASRVWDDQHLWPDLYVLNKERFENPDLILPGQRVDIYPSLKADGRLSDSELSVLMDAYVETYQRYRALGEEALASGRDSNDAYLLQRSRLYINKAQWLLYSGLRYSRDLLETHAGEIDDRDIRVVREYVDRFGYLPDP
ncbi:MAG: hypothetical protein GVY29_10495 [Spirochaetes bacterium]|jgi:hypothetical protein|nr:hypothetical protein [Spirochaetota bacterium]